MANNLCSLELERNLLGGIINDADSIDTVRSFFTENDFSQEEHRVIYSSLAQLKDEKKFNKSLLIHRIKSLGMKFKGDLDIGEYIDAISFHKASRKAIEENCAEVKKLSVLREIDKNSREVSNYLSKHKADDINEIISEVDKIYADTLGCVTLGGNEPEDLFADARQIMLDRGNNPIDHIGLKMPFKCWNDEYGDLRRGNVYAVASRPSQGKSTFLSHVAVSVSKANGDIPVLILDTEMSTGEIRDRNIAAVTGVPLDDVETGHWNTNPEMKKRMFDGLNDLDSRKNIYHYAVGNKTIDEVVNIAKRWFWKNVGRGKDCLIVYDYLKLTGEKVSGNWAEYQIIGEKTDKLKKLGEELNCPIFTAVQINRSGENIGKKVVIDDSSVIAQSDRIMWFLTVLCIFRQKVLEEISAHGPDFGTHMLIPLKRRYMGKKAKGYREFIQITNEKGEKVWQKNFINYDIQNFEVKERGTLVDISRANELKVEALKDVERVNEEEVFK